jgi:hypothetical protein
MAEFISLQPRIQTPLLLIEQAVEQDDGRFEFMGQGLLLARNLRLRLFSHPLLSALLGRLD